MTNDRKEVRHYIGAAGIFVLIVALLLFLSFVEIPPVNKDLFVAIVGTLVSSLGMVVYTIIGQQPDEVNKLQKKNLLQHKNPPPGANPPPGLLLLLLLL